MYLCSTFTYPLPPISTLFPYTTLFRSGGHFEFGDADVMSRRLLNNRLNLGMRKRTTEHRHGSFAVDDRGHAKFFIHIAARPKPGRLRLGTPAEGLEWCDHRRHNCSQPPEK